MKILFVVERPTQFEAPFFRHAAADPKHRFEVLFTRPSPGGSVHDPELGRTVSWGIDLLSGYSWDAPESDRPLDPSIAFSPAQGEGGTNHPAPTGSGSTEMGAWRRSLWVAREIRRRRPDLVIVNGYTQREYVAAALAARLAGVPAALRIDSVLFPGDGRPGRIKRLTVSRVLTGLFRLFLTTGTLGRRYLATCGVPETRIGLFPYAVDVEHFRRGAALTAGERRRERAALGVPAEARAVLALAKLSPREAPWDLLRAFCGLPGDDLRLLLGGDGPERAALEAFATGHETGPGTGRVRFLGYVPYPRLPALYGVSDLFVHPAAEERWGVSVTEALAAGLPVVASSRVGAAHELVQPGQNGFLYPAGDAPGLARVLEEALRLDPAAVAAHNEELLAGHDYPSTWKGLLEAAARTVPARPGRPPAATSGDGRPPGRDGGSLPPIPRRQRWIPRLIEALPRPLRRHKVIGALIRLLPWARVATFRFNGNALVSADLSDPAPRQVLIAGVFEPELFTVCRCFVAPGTAVLDVGANHGFFGFGLLAETPPSQGVALHLFEANPVLCQRLRETVRLYPEHTVRVREGCVTDAAGRSLFHVVPGHSGCSHVAETGRGAPVDNIVLDAYLETAGVSRVSLAKLDVEGWEPQAVRGLAGALAGGRIGALFLEVSGPHLARYGTGPDELIGLLRSLGCEIFWCKAEDFAAGRAPAPRVVTVQDGRALPLARVEAFPADHQTDLLAIPRSGMFGPLLERLLSER